MAVIVRIPMVLRKLTKSQAEVFTSFTDLSAPACAVSTADRCDAQAGDFVLREASGPDILTLISDLEAKYPGIKERICDGEGKIRRFVNVFINDEDIRLLGNEAAKLKDGDVISIVPAVAGG